MTHITPEPWEVTFCRRLRTAVVAHPTLAVSSVLLVLYVLVTLGVSDANIETALAIMRESNQIAAILGSFTAIIPELMFNVGLGTLLLAGVIGIARRRGDLYGGSVALPRALGLLAAGFLLMALGVVLGANENLSVVRMQSVVPVVAFILALGICTIWLRNLRLVALLFVGSLVINLILIANAVFWAPTENISTQSGAAYVGYILNESNDSVIFLNLATNRVARINSQDILYRQICQRRHGHAILYSLFGSQADEYPRCVETFKASGESPDADLFGIRESID